MEGAERLRHTTDGSPFSLREVQVRQALAHLSDELGTIAPFFKWGLDHHPGGHVVKHFVHDVFQLIKSVVLCAIDLQNTVVGSLALALFFVLARVVETWHGVCVCGCAWRA